MEFFEMHKFFGKITNWNLVKKFFTIITGYSKIIGHMHLFYLNNEPSPKPLGWKLWEE